jgi:enediyne biosynthesis protein E4
VKAGGRTQIREVRTGASYCSQHDLTLIVGLGDAEEAERVTVRWPWRGTQEWQKLPAGRVHVLQEGVKP